MWISETAKIAKNLWFSSGETWSFREDWPAEGEGEMGSTPTSEQHGHHAPSNTNKAKQPIARNSHLQTKVVSVLPPTSSLVSSNFHLKSSNK